MLRLEYCIYIINCNICYICSKFYPIHLKLFVSDVYSSGSKSWQKQMQKGKMTFDKAQSRDEMLLKTVQLQNHCYSYLLRIDTSRKGTQANLDSYSLHKFGFFLAIMQHNQLQHGERL